MQYAVDAFLRQFLPVEGGYIYYPGRKSGGKRVTQQEYDDLAAGWQRVAGLGGQAKMAGVVVGAIFVQTMLEQAGLLPGWSGIAVTVACVAGITGRLFYAAAAPRRLVSGRPDSAPPRASSQARREARKLLRWPLVIAALVGSALTFAGTAMGEPDGWQWWAWLIGSGVLTVGYAWIGLQKLRDG